MRIHRVIVHEIKLGDVEDPDLYVAEPIYQWQQSEVGKWVMEHSVETPKYLQYIDIASYGYTYKIEARLTNKDYVWWTLKYR